MKKALLTILFVIVQIVWACFLIAAAVMLAMGGIFWLAARPQMQ